MEWYWWALIIIGVVVIVWLKVLFVPKFLKKQREKKAERTRLEDED